jgi:hypothetical protein
VTNPYYESGSVNALSRARASIVNAEFGKIELAFDGLHESLNDFGTATSASEITLGTGVKALTIVGGHFIQVGQQVAVSSAVTPITHYMIGVVTDYDTGTGEAEVTVSNFEGTGTLSNWVVSITPRGFFTAIQGLTGVQTVPAIKAGLDITDVTTAAVALKAPIASPAFTGNPTAPTAAKTDNDTSIATTAHVQLNTAWTVIATAAGGVGISTVAFTSIPTHYKDLMLVANPIGADSATVFSVSVSNNGTNWATGFAIDVTNSTTVEKLALIFHGANNSIGIGAISGGFKSSNALSINDGLGATPALLPRMWVASGGIAGIRCTVTSPRIFNSTSVFTLLGR